MVNEEANEIKQQQAANPQEEIDATTAQVLELAENTEAETTDVHTVDYSTFQKNDFVELLSKLLDDVKEQPSVAAFRKSEDVLKEVRPLFEQFKTAERAEALAKFKEANDGSEDGFEFKFDETIEKFDKLFKALKEERAKYFNQIEKERDKNFSQKTELLNRLRAIVEGEDNTDPAQIKAGFAEFKKIQDEWKSAGNINSPHNNTLWQTYHALVDRFYSNRSIYFELLELDRKRNLQHKIELCSKIEKIAEAAKSDTVTGKVLDEAVAIFEEYKHIGPAPKEENELIWTRVKEALDVIYGKRREQLEAQKAESEQVYTLKSSIAELVETFANFTTESISEWNERTKALLALQDQWNNVKGFMPKEKGKELSDKFWGNIKTFFKNKGEFFRQLEGKREENLKAKVAIIEQVEALLTSGDDSQDATNSVIQLQKSFREVGHVPEKDKDNIYERFKKACDSFFDAKRAKNQNIEKEFEANLAKKVALCEQIEAEAVEGAETSKLADFKAQWAGIGFVPKKDMQSIGKRYISAINKYVSAMGKLSGKEREQLALQTEVDILKSRGDFSPRELGKKENDIRRKIQQIENDISLYKNNLEFFAKSKNADKLRVDVEAKIKKAEQDLAHFKHQLKVIREAEK
ncbi:MULTISPECIES: DUF349 domain-containing protein [Flectobacillus]|uniref:DUF349 domain-containing protein n=1 Tax=Flectobacillus roseus TaxID=502259 RepID=A0ABT6Y591_9BACT|nr:MULTISPECIES: DUF349 domain-containing protein [Flectobacillus]MDI9858739.1 DUF349 domain-containing protein [Flectobacillus roseus]MDI9869352.1 DUF349 domain-containing protein [Flectobacillus roseus]NBA75924.1 DUF349 domain-containing protein [Emticicia sp. ODNR4P]PAC32417.1 hypothetical protein BWI92_04180 [Flectobacillus sp. BAB-3569]